MKLRACFSRKYVILITALILTVVLGACGGSDEVKAPTEEGRAAGGEPVTGEFVRKVDGRDDFLVAVVAEGTGADRRVRLYLCSQTEKMGEWLASPTQGNSAALNSEDGNFQAEVILTGDTASGTIRLGGGRALRFDASRPRGIGGLYGVNISADGKLTGSDSLSGATTEGQVSKDPTGEKPFVYPVRQSYTAPGGESVQVTSGGTDPTPELPPASSSIPMAIRVPPTRLRLERRPRGQHGSAPSIGEKRPE